MSKTEEIQKIKNNSINQIQTIINNYDGTNYFTMIEAIKVRISNTKEMLLDVELRV
jgi:hypothetical protein